VNEVAVLTEVSLSDFGSADRAPTALSVNLNTGLPEHAIKFNGAPEVTIQPRSTQTACAPRNNFVRL
jgi:hypothetical protein